MVNLRKTYTYVYDFIDPKSNENPKGEFAPSFRGENQLIIYTDNFPLKTKNNGTGVNAWGYEAAVNSQGIVVALADRVKIPTNGYVLSGNSKAAKFIENNILLGSRVILNKDNKEITIIVNKLKSLYLTFKSRLIESLRRYDYAINNYYLINKIAIENNLEKIKEYRVILQKIARKSKVDSLTYKQFMKVYKKSNKTFDLLYLLTSNSTRIASRNAWIRPSEQTLDEVLNLLKACESCKINGLYVESFYNGDIPGISAITDTNEEVKDGYYGDVYKKDYLKALITEAHKRNIEVHAWVECFFVGEKSSQWKKRYKDEWHMVNYDGSTIQGNNDEGNEKDFVWLDPANPECLKYVLSIYEELLTKYDFDGINVDYVRYPHGNLNLYSSNGYTKYAMDEFKKLNNLTGDVKELVKDNAIKELWVQYRCNKITTLMSEVRKLVNRVKPNCLISTAVVSDLNYAIYNKMQNWKLWARKGWLDLTLPMAYYIGCSEIAVATKELVSFNKENAFSYTGIMCTGKDLPGMLVVKQINTLLANNADGYALFDLSQLLARKDCQRNLKKSTNRIKSVHPHSSPDILLKNYVLSLNDRRNIIKTNVDELIIDLKKIKDYSLNNVTNSLKEIVNNLNDKVLVKEINQLIHFINIQKHFKKHRMYK